jgi:hypothetical protein
MLQVFMPWEGVAAERAGVELNTFKLADYGIPYCYSPVLAAHPDTLASNPDMVKTFLAATAKGFEYAAQNPAEAAQLLCAEVDADVSKSGKPLPEPLEQEMVAASQAVIGQHYLQASSKQWGRLVKELTVFNLQGWGDKQPLHQGYYCGGTTARTVVLLLLLSSGQGRQLLLLCIIWLFATPC